MSVQARQQLRFGTYRLAGPHGPLLAADEVVALAPKPLAVLMTLIRHAGEVVTKEQLLAAVWPGVVVTEGVVSACLRDLRRALEDDARNPRYIATAHRIGYRFIAEVTNNTSNDTPSTTDRSSSNDRSLSNDESSPRSPAQPAAALLSPFVGRDAELARLHTAFACCLAGRRQLVFVTGEAGIGKTCLIDTFLSQLDPGLDHGCGKPGATDTAPRVARGQCVELHGAGEPYMPILEALGRLCRNAAGNDLVAPMRRHAPTLSTQLAGLRDDNEALSLKLATAGSSGDRMLRETVEFIEIAAASAPLVVILEDMHWSDPTTVDWLNLLARRSEATCLLVIVSCRPVELIVDRHPLKAVKHELVSRGAASEMLLGYLTAGAVQDYVLRRLSDDGTDLAQTVYRRSQGHPLFMARLVDDLALPPPRQIAGERMPQPGSDAALPNSVRELIDAQLDRLGAEHQAALAAASVAGLEFATASVAAGLQWPEHRAERCLEELARRDQFVEARGLSEWHDGTVSGRYRFRHDLYRETLYYRLGAAQRTRVHARIGECLERAYGPHTSEIATELASHFELAKDAARAARHYREAAETALRRCACRVALAHVDKGLALLAAHPDRVDTDRTELLLRLTQGAALLATEGFGGREVEATYLRARDLSLRLDDTGALGPVLAGLWNLHLTRAAFAPAGEIAKELYALADSRNDPVLSMLAHNLRAQGLLFAGEPAPALAHVEPSLALHDPRRHPLLAVEYGEDPGVVCHHCAALANLILGRAERAAWHLEQGLTLARMLSHPFSEAQMLWMKALVCRETGDRDQVHEAATKLVDLCVDNEFPLWLAGGRMLRGWALASGAQPAQGLDMARSGLEDWLSTGTQLMLPYSLALLASLCAANGNIAEARQLIERAIATTLRTGERWYEAELYRLRGEIGLLQAGPREPVTALAEARVAFRQAIELARQQHAGLFERRAAASLARTRRHNACDRVSMAQGARNPSRR